jgi:plastocyanin/uncharacterized membrane protein YozB (DUF420 family)
MGILPGNAPSSPNLNLTVQLAMGVALVVGMWLARRKRYRAHAVCQSAVVLLNLIPIAGYMLPVFWRAVLPGVPARLGDTFYTWPTAHAAAGFVAELLGLYVILRAGTNLLPGALRFENYKLWMRTTLVLWWLTIALGVGTYYDWYLTDSEHNEAAPVARSGAPVQGTTAASPAAVPTPADVIVEMRNFTFEPKELTVAPGTTVVWHDAVGRHSVKADDGSFESAIMPVGGEFRHTFKQPGRYPFYCTLHGSAGGHEMAGVVTVAPGGQP